MHTVASANRLADVVSLFDSDLRIQLVFTCPDESAMPNGVAEYLQNSGASVISWTDAVTGNWDLAITANTRGNIHDVTAPLIVMSHGVGYSKNLPESRKAGKPESRKAGKPESRVWPFARFPGASGSRRARCPRSVA
ncbi:hypothetical protein [Alloactinosynnema sp. L-07]|nr:hypothetical protein [Alloactinosynnema sp. L-07]